VFVMELPAYRWPRLRSVLRRSLEAGRAFVVRAGTIILAAMILVWALLYFPHTDAAGTPYDERIEQAEKAAKDAETEIKKRKDSGQEVPEELEAVAGEPDRLRGEWRRNSLLGRAGLFLEPAFRPLGWDWKIGMAAIASFPAREVMVGT